MQSLCIKNEDEAWAAIEKALKNEIDADISNIEFDGWPTLTLHLTGPKFHGTITSTVMESLLEVQRNLNRSYAKIRYDKPDGRHITDEDRDQIELVVKVSEGSSELEAALANALEKIAVTVGDKMEPVHFVILILGTALLYFGHSYLRAKIDAGVKEKQIQADTVAKQEDTQRLATMANAISQSATLRAIKDDAEDAHYALLKSASAAKTASVLGIDIEPDIAAQLIKTKRERSKDARLDGIYTVTVADKSNPDDPRCRLVADNGDEFTALVIDENWTDEQKAHFHEAFWKNKKVELAVNAKTLRGQVMVASVVGVTVPKI